MRQRAAHTEDRAGASQLAGPDVCLPDVAATGAPVALVGFRLAAPIVATILMIVQKAYVRDTLKQPVAPPGEHEPDA